MNTPQSCGTCGTSLSGLESFCPGCGSPKQPTQHGASAQTSAGAGIPAPPVGATLPNPMGHIPIPPPYFSPLVVPPNPPPRVMSFGQAISFCFTNYENFNRASRSEYWYFYLFTVLPVFALNFASGLVGSFYPELGFGLTLVYFMFALAVLVPVLSVGTRRLHDTGRPGGFLALGLIPCVGAIILIVLLSQMGETTDNKYGPAR